MSRLVCTEDGAILGNICNSLGQSVNVFEAS